MKREHSALLLKHTNHCSTILSGHEYVVLPEELKLFHGLETVEVAGGQLFPSIDVVVAIDDELVVVQDDGQEGFTCEDKE